MNPRTLLPPEAPARTFEQIEAAASPAPWKVMNYGPYGAAWCLAHLAPGSFASRWDSIPFERANADLIAALYHGVLTVSLDAAGRSSLSWDGGEPFVPTREDAERLCAARNAAAPKPEQSRRAAA